MEIARVVLGFYFALAPRRWTVRSNELAREGEAFRLGAAGCGSVRTRSTHEPHRHPPSLVYESHCLPASQAAQL